MMAHIRQQIRDHVVSILSSAVTLVSGRVYNTRIYPLTKSKLPAVNVTTLSDTSSVMTIGGVFRRRASTSVSLIIDCHVAVTDTFDDDLDAICVQVEDAIGGDFTFGGLCKQALLGSIEIEASGEGETPVGVARLTYDVQLHSKIMNVDGSWILSVGTWDDSGEWVDSEIWRDSA